jgi:arsenical pump membrane protein
MIGAVAASAGLFRITGVYLARLHVGEFTRYACVAGLVAVVSAVLNLDTAAAFLTPVLVHMGRSRKQGLAPVLYVSLLMANAGSLLLPGSNLTNIIVTGHLHLSGATFAAHMAGAWTVSVLVTAAVVGIAFKKDFRPLRVQQPEAAAAPNNDPAKSRQLALSATIVAAAAVLMIALHNAALAVLGVGIVAVVNAILTRAMRPKEAATALDAPVLVGLFGLAVAVGALGRSWELPYRILGHLDAFATAGFAAVTSVLINNLPAASLLAARTPPHPYELLVGLDVGPNLFVTGSLSALLWLKAARQAGAKPSIRRVAAIGSVSAVIAMVGGVGVLAAGSLH